MREYVRNQAAIPIQPIAVHFHKVDAIRQQHEQIKWRFRRGTDVAALQQKILDRIGDVKRH